MNKVLITKCSNGSWILSHIGRVFEVVYIERFLRSSLLDVVLQDPVDKSIRHQINDISK